MSLSGKYSHQLDAKNRMRIPARLKKDLGDECCFAMGDHHCVYVYPQAEMDAKIEMAKQTKISDIEKQRSLRIFMSTISPAVEDNQGRIDLNPELRAHLNFERNEKDIIFLGMGSRVEIWSKSNYENYVGGGKTDYDSVIANLDF